MDYMYCLNQLAMNTITIHQMVNHVDSIQAPWKPDAAQWSVLEVINHLVDIECEDFRPQLHQVLAGSDEPLPAIDPQQWVRDRAYNQRDLGTSVARYCAERQHSLTWLQQVADVNWSIRSQHPQQQRWRAGDLLVAWVAHDVLHLRQLVEVQWAYNLTRFTSYDPSYAGTW